jgi:hypothetical protein
MENNDRSKNNTKSNSRRKKRVDKLEGATQGEKLKFIIVGGLTAKSPTQGQLTVAVQRVGRAQPDCRLNSACLR